MQQAASISRIGHAPPTKLISIKEAMIEAGRTERSAKPFEKIFGQKTVARINADDLERNITISCREALEGTEPNSVTHILYAHTLNHTFPNDPGMLFSIKEILGLTCAKIFPISQLACTSGVYTLELAKRIVEQNPRSKILVVCGERSVPIGSKLRENVILMGESSVAALVQLGNKNLLGYSAFLTDGKYHQSTITNKALQNEYDRSYQANMERTIRTSLKKEHIEASTIDSIYGHNVSKLSWSGITQSLNISHENLKLPSLGAYGHCFTADPLINLYMTIKEQPYLSQHGLLCAAGVGATYGSMVIKNVCR